MSSVSSSSGSSSLVNDLPPGVTFETFNEFRNGTLIPEPVTLEGYTKLLHFF